jgi:DNA-binding MarR family transcriptional regulator
MSGGSAVNENRRRDAGPDEPGVSPAANLNDVVHQRVRLGLLAVLHEVRTADFPYLRSVLNVTDGNLGQHIEILRRNGLVEVTKGYEGKRPRTWIAVTRAGDNALRSEIDALKRLLTLY